jgi:hypothetical protein
MTLSGSPVRSTTPTNCWHPHGWDTQEATRREWDDLPEANRAVMLDVVRTLLEANVIKP